MIQLILCILKALWRGNEAEMGQ